MATKLTDKQKLFIEEFLIDRNATQAAIRAGYSKKTARVIGAENLTKPAIAERIRKRTEARVDRTQITQDFVLTELLKIAKADGTRFATINGRGTVKLTPTEELMPEERAAVASIKKGRFGTEIRTYDKVRALELLGKHLGLFDNSANAESEAIARLDALIESIDDEAKS